MSEVATKPAKPRRRRLVLVGVVVLASIAIVFVVVHLVRAKKPKPAPAAQVVTVAKAVAGSMPEVLNELGTVTPTATVTVLPQLSGYLVAVGYREGEDVRKGQFLAQIDPRQYQIDLQQAEAQLAKDRAVLAQARSDLSRYEQLSERKSIAAQTFADQQFLVQQDEAATQADLANIAQYRLDLAYCHITAPIAGRVGLRLVDPGNYVTASSSPGIVVITTTKPTTVQFTVPQDSLAAVLRRPNGGAGLPVTVYSSDNSTRIATGTLYAVSNQMATATGTVTLRASFANEDEALFPNEFVNVQLLVDTLQNAVLVPTPAVQSGAPGDYVYLVNADQTVSVHKVALGPSDGKNTVIASGLQVGDVVVTDGTDRLSDGARIRTAAPQAARNPASDAPGGTSGQRRRTGSGAPAAASTAS